MGGLTKKTGKSFFRGCMLSFGAAFAFAFLLLAGTANALPIPLALSAMQAAADKVLHPVRGGACRDSCPDCTDCPTEIDITPGPYPEPQRDDPIGHAIKRLEPSPLLAPDSCPESDTERRGDASSGCGIRSWYWRLRYGYCGPGCEYYRYRLGSRERFPEPVIPQYHHRECKS